MDKIKQEKAITLVTLIITIVILIILAVVVVSSIKSNDIILYAHKAKSKYGKEQEDELQKYNALLDKYDDINNEEMTEEYTVTFVVNEDWDWTPAKSIKVNKGSIAIPPDEYKVGREVYGTDDTVGSIAYWYTLVDGKEVKLDTLKITKDITFRAKITYRDRWTNTIYGY